MNRPIWLEQLGRDLSHAIRGLWRAPGLALTATITIALGVGLNTTIFSIVDSTLFKRLPYERPEELVTLAHRLRPGTAMETFAVGVSWDEIDTWRSESAIFEGIEGSRYGFTRRWREADRDLECGSFTAGLPALLGLSPRIGRFFTAAEVKDDVPLVVIAESLWIGAFGRRPDVIGSSMTIDNRAYTIVGVMPRSFRYNPGSSVTQAWTGTREHRDPSPFGGSTIFRVRRGLTLEAAHSLAAAAAQRMQQVNPPKEPWTPRLLPIAADLRGEHQYFLAPMRLLLLTAAVVLLVACASVANLLWTRTDARGRELAMRTILGASRGRLFRLLLCEGLVIGVLGGIAAVVLAWWSLDLVVGLIPTYFGRSMFAVSPAALDTRALLFAVAVTLIVSVLAATWPAIAGARNSRITALGRQVAGWTRARRRVSQTLQAAQIGLAFVLTTTAGLFATSFIGIVSANTGLDTNGLGVVWFTFPEGRYPTDAAQRLARDEALARVRAVPGVRQLGVGNSPLASRGGGRFVPEGSTASAGSLAMRFVGAGYFETTGVRLVAGRDFGPGDTPASPLVAIIDEGAARRLYGNASPIGRRFKYSPYVPDVTIVGVASAVLHADFVAEPDLIGMYLAESQDKPTTIFLIRTDANNLPATLKGAQQALTAFDSGITSGASPAADFFETHETFSVPRFYLVLVSAFAVLALVTASVGVYGLVAYSMAQRRREVGIRLALGSSLAKIRALVLVDASRPVLAGLAVGALVAWWTVGLTQSLLYGIGARDPRAFAIGAVTLLGAALLAVLAPMRRASRTDPAEALRSE